MFELSVFIPIKAVLYICLSLFLGVDLLRLLFGKKLAENNKINQRFQLIYLASGCLIILTSIFDTLIKANQLMGSLDFSLYWSYLLETRHGQMAIIRSVVVLLLFIAINLRLFWLRLLIKFILGFILILTISFVSHAGASGGILLISDVIHLIFMTIWAGQLICLAVIPWKDKNLFIDLLTKFSNIALISVILLAMTGIYTAWRHLDDFQELFTTAWGLTLAIKVCIFAVVLLVASRNRFHYLPLLKKDGDISLIKTNLRLEAVLLIFILIATAILANQAHPIK